MKLTLARETVRSLRVRTEMRAGMKAGDPNGSDGGNGGNGGDGNPFANGGGGATNSCRGLVCWHVTLNCGQAPGVRG